MSLRRSKPPIKGRSAPEEEEEEEEEDSHNLLKLSTVCNWQRRVY
jgi:hypothetical protein